jgi:phosphatidylinositol-bisphosphatase
MNYRISHANEQVRKAISELSTVPLHEKDQLRCEMKLQRAFINYSEAAIDFMPTYKFDPYTDNYDTSEKLRTPSWTDRILYHTKRTKVRHNNEKELELIQPIRYTCAKTIKFSDHRPVSGLYLVAIKYECDEKRLNHIREESIRQFDREENDSIPTIDVHPRPPAIVFNNIRYLDKVSYSLSIKNIGECPCTCTICPSSMFQPTAPKKMKQSSEEPFFDCLIFTPNSPYFIEIGEEQHIDISFQMKSQYSWLFGKQLNEILILHVENGADTFITLDITLDMGPFGLSLNQFPTSIYDTEIKQYIYSPDSKITSERFVEMKNDPPVLYILLIDCLKERRDINLLNIFNSEIQDSIDLIPIRDQIYDHNYNFQNYSSIHLFMILLYLLRSLPEPLISRDVQNKIFLTNNNKTNNRLPTGVSIQSHIPTESCFQQDMTKAVTIIIEQLKSKERNLFLRFLSLLQKLWPTTEQINKFDNDARNVFNVCSDILALSILQEYANRNQRHDFLLACLNEEKKKHVK